MRPAQRRRDRTLDAPGIVERIVPAVGVGLENAGEAAQVALGVFLPPIARGVVKSGWRGAPTERPIITDIGPDVTGDRLAFCQDRHRGVVAVKPLGGFDMRLDQGVERREGGRRGADWSASVEADNSMPSRP